MRISIQEASERHLKGIRKACRSHPGGQMKVIAHMHQIQDVSGMITKCSERSREREETGKIAGNCVAGCDGHLSVLATISIQAINL